MNVTICDRCGEQDATWCWRHRMDECTDCARECVAGGTGALRGNQ